MWKPFALEIYRRYLNGETPEQLSESLGIPLERIEQRLRAAEAYVARMALAA
jgi:DNA-directed RNA polymerase specialized sigma24 family protein